MNFPLPASDILMAAILAYIITWVILRISSSFNNLFFNKSMLKFHQYDLSKIVRRCYILFPKEFITFGGKTFERGMFVRVTTRKKKIFEGKFIGVNDQGIACFITKSFIVAQEVDNISSIDLIQ